MIPSFQNLCDIKFWPPCYVECNCEDQSRHPEHFISNSYRAPKSSQIWETFITCIWTFREVHTSTKVICVNPLIQARMKGETRKEENKSSMFLLLL